MDSVQKEGQWTRGPCFVLTPLKTKTSNTKTSKMKTSKIKTSKIKTQLEN